MLKSRKEKFNEGGMKKLEREGKEGKKRGRRAIRFWD